MSPHDGEPHARTEAPEGPCWTRHRSNHTGNLRYGNEPSQLWAACPAMAKPEWIAESISWVDWPKTTAAKPG